MTPITAMEALRILANNPDSIKRSDELLAAVVRESDVRETQQPDILCALLLINRNLVEIAAAIANRP